MSPRRILFNGGFFIPKFCASAWPTMEHWYGQRP
jgi:hypothetical protein